MRRFINKRVPRRKAVWGTGVVVAAAVAATASLAIAQAPPRPDGSPGGGHPGPDPVTTTSCGANLSSTVITQDAPNSTNVVGFTPLPGASKEFAVPQGTTRCVKVLFTAETACGPSAGPDFCYVQAVIDNVPMDPDGGGFQAIDSEDGTASGHAYEWVKRVGPGNHTVELEWRVLAAGTQFYIDDWTFDVQLFV